MKIEFILKNYRLYDKTKELFEKKLTKLDKYLDEDTPCKLILQSVKDTKFIMECKIILDKSRVLRAYAESKDMLENIDTVIPKIEGQIRKIKTFNLKKVKSGSIDLLVEPKDEIQLYNLERIKTIELTRISVDEAIQELELLDREFYVFLNKDNNRVNLVYRRNDGKSGLLDLLY